MEACKFDLVVNRTAARSVLPPALRACIEVGTRGENVTCLRGRASRPRVSNDVPRYASGLEISTSSPFSRFKLLDDGAD